MFPYNIIEHGYGDEVSLRLISYNFIIFFSAWENVSLTDTFITKLSFLSNHISSKLPDPQSGNLIILVQGVAKHVPYDNVNLSLQLQQLVTAPLMEMVSTVESRDNITGEHSRKEKKRETEKKHLISKLNYSRELNFVLCYYRELIEGSIPSWSSCATGRETHFPESWPPQSDQK